MADYKSGTPKPQMPYNFGPDQFGASGPDSSWVEGAASPTKNVEASRPAVGDAKSAWADPTNKKYATEIGPECSTHPGNPEDPNYHGEGMKAH